MIVLHPSSRCDVCLEPYTWNTTSDTPHAIPCGHIFCKACLRTLSPSLCPLCRKAFVPDRAKRLHVDRPPENTGVELELDFLQRLALVSGEHAPPENVEEVMTEVQTWLEGQPSESNKPVRCAYNAIAKHQALKDKYIREKAGHKEVRRTLRHNDREANHDRRTARAIEERLLGQLQEMENDYTAKIEKLEVDLVAVRAENAKYSHTSNPLPPPPEPLPLDRFPPFVAAAWDAGLASTSNSSSQYPKNGAQTAAYSHPNGAPYVNGYSRPPMNAIPVASSSSIKSDVTRTSDRESTSKETTETGQHPEPFRHGSKRTHIYAPSGSSPPAAPPVPPKSHTQHPNQTHRVYPYSRSQSDSEYLHRNGIIPGAAPAQRIIPPPPKWPDTTSNSTHRPVPGTMRGWGDTTGKMQWGQVGESSSNSAANVMATQPRGTAVGYPSQVFNNTSIDTPNHFAPAAAFVSGYATGLGNGYAFVNGHYPTYDERQNAQISTSPGHLEQAGTEGLGLMNVPAPRQPGSVSPESDNPLHQRNARSNAVGNAGVTTTVHGAHQGGLYQNAPRRHGVGALQMGTERNSRSSWGTVETGEATRNSGVRGSLSELGLIGLHGVATGIPARGPGSTSESLLTTPVRLGHENGFMGADPVPRAPHREDDDEDEDEDDEDDEEEDDVLRSSAVEYGRRARVEYEDREGRSPGPQRQSREMDQRRSSRQFDTPAIIGLRGLRSQVESNSPSHTVRDGSAARGSRSSGENDNALALDFNPALNLNSSQSQSPPPSVSHHSQITAPTPIVSRPNIMSNWTLDNV